jgi:MFS family permease
MKHPAESPVQRQSNCLVTTLPFHYGWVILGASMLGMFTTLPGQTVGVALFLDPMMADLQLARPEISFLYSLGTLLGILPTPLVGQWIDRRGPRVAVTIFTTLLAATCLGMRLVNSSFGLLLGFTALRGLAVGGLSLVSYHIVNLWFVRRRGVAAGIAGLGMALGSMFFPLVITPVITGYGWQTAYGLVGIWIAATMVPVGAALYRERPESFGLQPDLQRQKDDSAVLPVSEVALSLKQAQRTRIFWLVTLASVLSNAIGTGLLLHHYSLMGEQGLDTVAAGAIFIPLATVQAIATLATSILCDIVEPLVLLRIGLSCLALAAFSAVLPNTYVWMYGVLLGLALGMLNAIAVVAYARYFGRAHLGAIRGFGFTLGVIGAAVGPLPLAWSKDLLGSYAPGVFSFAILPIVLAVSAVIIKPHAR